MLKLILLSSLQLMFLSNLCLGQGIEDICALSQRGIKSFTLITKKNNVDFPERVQNLFDQEGKVFKTRYFADTILIKTDTFIYNDQKQLIARLSINPLTKAANQWSEFLYLNGSNYRTVIRSFYITMTDSLTFDTTYFNLRYDFIRDYKERFTQRKCYISKTANATFDTLNFEITRHTWINDSLLFIEDHSSGQSEYLRKYFKNCMVVRTEILDSNNLVRKWYDYEYIDHDSFGNWALLNVYLCEGGERKLVKTQQREIVMY